MDNVLRNKMPSENILKLRELTLKMESAGGDEAKIYEIFKEISSILNKEEKFSCDNDKIKFYEKLYNQIRKLLTSIKF